MANLGKRLDQASTRSHNALSQFIRSADELDAAAAEFAALADEHRHLADLHAANHVHAQQQAKHSSARADKIRELLG